MNLRPGPQWTIASGQSLSNAINIGELHLAGIQFPSGWDAASVTFQASVDNVNFVDVYTTTAELSITAAGANRYILLDPHQFSGMRYIKIRSGVSATPVNQTANRIIRPAVLEFG